MRQIVFSCITFLSTFLFCFGQQDSTLPHYQLSGTVEKESLIFDGNLVISFAAPLVSGDTLWLRHWGDAYKKGSSLHRELIENQNTSLHFSNYKGAQTFDAVSINEQPVQFTKANTDWSFYIINEVVPKNQYKVSLAFKIQLPDISFNGVGVNWQDAANFFQISHIWPEIRFGSTTNQQLILAENNTKLLDIPQKKLWSVAIYFPDNYVCACNLKDYTTNFQGKQHLKNSRPEVLSNSFTLLCGKGYYEVADMLPDSTGQVILGIRENFPPNFSVTASVFRVREFLERITGQALNDTIRIALLPKGEVPPPSLGLLTLPYIEEQDNFELELVKQWSKALLTAHFQINQYTDTWFYTGLPEFIKQYYAEKNYPDKKFLGPFAKYWFAKFLDLDRYNSNYEQQLYFLYMARLSLDQPLSDPFTAHPKGNYLAVLEGKAAMNFSYLKGLANEKAFFRGLKRWFENSTETTAPLPDFIKAVQFYSNSDLSWWSGDVRNTNKRLDYAITEVHKCSYTLGVKVKNRGDLETPFSITGIKNGEPALTLWFEGFQGEKLIQFHFDDYDVLLIDYKNETPEWNNQNNYTRTNGLFPQVQPIKFQFFGSLENPQKTQIFWSPVVDFNAYDQVLLGINLFNTSLLRKKIEYNLAPEFSTGTGKLTGSGAITYNLTPRSGPFHHIYFGMFGRYNHYARDLAFSRLSPSIGFFFRKPNPRDENIHKIKLRLVSVRRELPNTPDFPNENAFDLNRASYDILDLRYWWEHVNILKPFTIRFDYQLADQFSKVSLDYDQRWMLPNRRWLIWRTFGGLFLTNDASETSFYDFGLSGTRDYLFDYQLLGRSDLSGIWSRQFFITDGGFKSNTELFASNWMVSTNIAIPIWKIFGVYGDLGWADNTRQTYWGYGLRISIFSDFFELYFPVQDYNTNYMRSAGYFSNTRFILNLSYDQIVQRLRRGFY